MMKRNMGALVLVLCFIGSASAADDATVVTREGDLLLHCTAPSVGDGSSLQGDSDLLAPVEPGAAQPTDTCPPCPVGCPGGCVPKIDPNRPCESQDTGSACCNTGQGIFICSGGRTVHENLCPCFKKGDFCGYGIVSLWCE